MWIPAEHQRFLDRALPLLQADVRLLGVAAGGSYIHEGLDEFSDLDLVLVCTDAARDALVTELVTLAESLGSTLTRFTGEHVGVPNMVICLYEDPLLHVDLKLVSLTEFGERIENPGVLFERDGHLTARMAELPPVPPAIELQWIEDRFWGWVHYTALKVGRGELFEVLAALEYLRGVVLGPLSAVAHGKIPRGVRRLESVAPRHAAGIEATVSDYEWTNACAALDATIELYQKLREELATPDLSRSRAEGPALRYLQRQIAARTGR
jgi:hypothetical protein